MGINWKRQSEISFEIMKFRYLNFCNPNNDFKEHFLRSLMINIEGNYIPSQS